MTAKNHPAWGGFPGWIRQIGADTPDLLEDGLCLVDRSGGVHAEPRQRVCTIARCRRPSSSISINRTQADGEAGSILLGRGQSDMMVEESVEGFGEGVEQRLPARTPDGSGHAIP